VGTGSHRTLRSVQNCSKNVSPAVLCIHLQVALHWNVCQTQASAPALFRFSAPRCSYGHAVALARIGVVEQLLQVLEPLGFWQVVKRETFPVPVSGYSLDAVKRSSFQGKRA